MALSLTVYIRPGCHLCEEATERIRSLASTHKGDATAIEIVEIDIESDDDLHRKFMEQIPVIEIDGEIVSKLIEYRDRAFAETIAERLADSY